MLTTELTENTNVAVVIGADGRELREYFCKMCPEKAKGYTVPEGWFVVRRTHKEEDGPKTIGLYSSSRCLATDIISRELHISLAHTRLLMATTNPQ